MEYPKGFRQTARDALRGKWRVAILTGLVASPIGASTITNNSGIKFSIDNSDNMQFDISSFKQYYPLFFVLLTVFMFWYIATIVVGGAGKLGYAKFNLNLIDGEQATFSDLFSQFNRLGAGFGMNILVRLYAFLWTLLFIVPGVVKSYSYAMTPYILSEHPEMTVNEAITESRRIMNGNRWNLFCLQLSFIGWTLLGTVPIFIMMILATVGILNYIICLVLSLIVAFICGLFLAPYQEASRAAFYREISH